MTYNAWRLTRPRVLPPYSSGESWVIHTWWARIPPQTEPSPR